jgi:hypothetical protein
MAEYPYDEVSGDIPAPEPVEPDPYIDPVAAEPPPPPEPPAAPPVEEPPPPPVEEPPPPPVEEPPPPPVEEAPPPPPEEPPEPPVDEAPPAPPEDPDADAGSVEQRAASDAGPADTAPADDAGGPDDHSPVRPGQPGFEADDAGGPDDQSPVRPGQPGFEADLLDELPEDAETAEPTDAAPADDAGGPDDQSPVRPGQPGFESSFLDELPQDDAAGDEQAADQSPFAPDQPGIGESLDDIGFVFEPTDMSCWCTEGLPEGWEPWTSPVEESPDSWTDHGYSTDWGVVEPDWAVAGEAPLTTVEPERLLSNAVGAPGDVVGPGHALDVYWRDQGDKNYCVLYSVHTVLAELQIPHDIDEMVQRATANGWFQYDDNTGELQGIKLDDIDRVLASYGVGSHQIGGYDADDKLVPVTESDAVQALNTALVNNHRVIVGVDGDEIASGRDDLKDLDSNHVVAVSGIDYARRVVILNDSARGARGAGLEIPLDVFMDTWRDSNFSLTITDTSMPGDGTSSPPPDGGPNPDQPGISLIGTTLMPEPGPETGPIDTGDPTTVMEPDPPPGPEPAPAPQPLGDEQDGQEGQVEAKKVTAEAPDGASAEHADGGLEGDGLARPMAVFGDLPADLAGIDLAESVSENLDLGIDDEGSDAKMPHGILDEIKPDEGIIDAILDLLGSVDDVVVDVAKEVLSIQTQNPSINR